MRLTLISLASALLALCFLPLTRADYPKPSPYPISWQLNFTHEIPKRVVVEVAGRSAPVAYWYMTYTVTNNTDQERTFLPIFEMVTHEGKVIRSDKDIPKVVFDTIKKREKKEFLEPWTKIGGELLLGEDQTKDGVAIWEEPMPRMGKFTIYVGGLSGEHVQMKDDQGNVMKDKNGEPLILRKTLKLDFHIRGDEVYPGEDEVDPLPEEWVMR
jgi:hypothetical protein